MSEERLRQIQDIDSDLVEEAAHASRRSRRPVFAAAAACLLIAGGIGAALLTGQDGTIPDKSIASGADLPVITIDEADASAFGFEGYMAHDVSELLSTNPGLTATFDTLPVIRNPYRTPTAEPPLDDMKAALKEAAAALGMDAESLEIRDNAPSEKELAVLREKAGEAGEEEIPPEWLITTIVYMEDDRYRVEVDASLTVTTFCLTQTALDASSPDALRAAAPGIRSAFEAYIGMQDAQAEICGGDFTTLGQRLLTLAFYENGATDTEKLLRYHFDRAVFHGDESGNLYLVRRRRTDLSDVVGEYPRHSCRRSEKAA